MVKKITYQQKLKFLPILALIAFLLVYWFAISETLEFKKKYDEILKQATIMEKAPEEMVTLKNKLERLNKISGQNTLETGIDPLMEIISKLVARYHVTLSDYGLPHVFQYHNCIVETRTITMEGSYIPCLQIMHDLEKNYQFGKVVSANFTSKIDFRTSRKHLFMQLYIQAIKDNNDQKNISENNYAHEK